MNELRYNILLLLLLVIGIACDKIDGPYTETPDELLSTVTIVEFTGIGCVNCPERGHEVIEEYKQQFGNKVQSVALHGDEFGTPIQGFYLRTSEAQELIKELNVKGLPKGLVSGLNTSDVKVPLELSADIAALGYQIPEMVIDVSMQVSENKIELSINGKCENLISNYNELYICAYLLQTNIIGPQKDSRGDHDAYSHKHAFRKAFTSVLGNVYAKNPSAGMIIEEMNYSIELNEANLIWAENETIEDLEIEPLVFIYNKETSKIIPVTINYN